MIISRILGVGAGLILYPLKSLLMNVIGFAAATVMGTNALLKLAFPDSYFSRAISFLPVVIPTACLTLLFTLLVTPYDLVRTAYNGAESGWNKGLFHVFHALVFKASKFSTLFALCFESTFKNREGSPVTVERSERQVNILPSQPDDAPASKQPTASHGETPVSTPSASPAKLLGQHGMMSSPKKNKDAEEGDSQDLRPENSQPSIL